jgi:hypothetical protein
MLRSVPRASITSSQSVLQHPVCAAGSGHRPVRHPAHRGWTVAARDAACLMLLFAGSIGSLPGADAPVSTLSLADPDPTAVGATVASGPGAALLPAPRPGFHRLPLPGLPVGFLIPDGWITSFPGNGITILVRSPLPVSAGDPDPARSARLRACITVVIQPLVRPESPRAFAQRCRDHLERLTTGLRIDRDGPRLLAGRPWYRLDDQFRTGQLTWRQRLYATVVDAEGICVVCGSGSEAGSRWDACFDALLGDAAASDAPDTDPSASPVPSAAPPAAVPPAADAAGRSDDGRP